MAGGLALCGALWLGTTPGYADGLTSSPNPSVVGQTVTFTWSFTMACSDGAQVTFTVDGQNHGASSTTSNGIHFTSTYATAFSSVGNHMVTATYDGSPMPNCRGTSPPLIHRVTAPPPPPPPPPPPSPAPPAPSPIPTVEPKPTPSMSPSPAPAETPTAAASTTRVDAVMTNRGSTIPVGVAILVLATLAIATGVLLLRRRIRRS